MLLNDCVRRSFSSFFLFVFIKKILQNNIIYVKILFKRTRVTIYTCKLRFLFYNYTPTEINAFFSKLETL